MTVNIGGGVKMGLANLLTLARIALIPLFIFLLMSDAQGAYWQAALVFALAAVTDSIDGYVARHYNQVTRLGTFLDPLADKLLITAALVCLVVLQTVPAWIVIIILAREIIITWLRIIKARQGVSIPASWSGKLKTVTQIFAIMIIILAPLYRQFISYPLGTWAIYIAMAITVISGAEYIIKANKDEAAQHL